MVSSAGDTLKLRMVPRYIMDLCKDVLSRLGVKRALNRKLCAVANHDIDYAILEGYS